MLQNESRRLTVAEAARYVGLSPATLNMDRCTAKLGIPYMKLGRRVVYDSADLDNFLARHRCESTSDRGNASKAQAGA